MANEENLVPLTTSKAREIGKKGGQASAKKRAERKKFNELFNSFLDKEVTDEKIKEQLKQFGFEEFTNKNAMVLAQYKKALTGDTQAFTAVRDTINEKPKDKLEVEQNEPFQVNINVKK